MRGQGLVAELVLLDGVAAARIVCDTALIPRPGQYTVAHDGSLDAPLATQLFASKYSADGFIAAPPVPDDWRPGARIQMRGPLGTGFNLPRHARRIALLTLTQMPAALLALFEAQHSSDMEFALVCDHTPQDLPAQLEVHPLSVLRKVCEWSEYAAWEIDRDSITRLMESVQYEGRSVKEGSAQVLVRTPMPCGGLAECGICTILTTDGARLACESGPVFNLGLLIGKS